MLHAAEPRLLPGFCHKDKPYGQGRIPSKNHLEGSLAHEVACCKQLELWENKMVLMKSAFGSVEVSHQKRVR
jgi:hypothetical protein